METVSIQDILEIKFGYKEKYDLEELKQINRLIIRRFDYDGQLINVEFNELSLLPNVEELTIKQCILDSNIVNIISKMPNLKKLLLFYCEIVDDVADVFKKLNIDYLVVDDTNLDLSILESLNLNKMVLANVKVNYKINFNTHELDIQRCIFDNIEYFNIDSISRLKVSYSQYEKYKSYLINYIDKLIIMEDNGQFVHMGEQ